MNIRRKFLALSLGVVIMSTLGHGVARSQQAVDTSPLKVVVAYPPGGSVDVTARLLAVPMEAELGRTVIVDNRPGASGTIGTSQVIRSEPDGSNIILASSIEISIQPVFNPREAYNPTRDLKPVGLVGKLPYVLVVRADSSIKSLNDLVEYGKANPGKLNFASFGNFSSPHLIGELLKMTTGINATHVPYKGSSPAVVDLLGGQVDFMFDTAVAALPQIRSGKMRALATTAEKNLPMAKEIPTMSELGYPDLTYEGWFGFFAPAKTPQSSLSRLQEVTAKLLAQRDIQDTLTSRFVLPSKPMSEFEIMEFLQKETARFAKLAAHINIAN